MKRTKLGRHPIKERNLVKNVMIGFKTNTIEHEKIKTAADKMDLTISNYCRICVTKFTDAYLRKV